MSDSRVSNVLELMEELGEAVAIYDRALFNYDPAFDENQEVQTDLTLGNSGAGVYSRINEIDYKSSSEPEFLSHLNDLGQHILSFYLNAGVALSQRYKAVQNLHSELLDKVRRSSVYEAERTPEYAKKSYE